MEYIDAKSILRTSDGSWFGCDYVANLYRGCSHGCIYCDSRSDCYAIKRFDTVRAKREALKILEDELAHKRKKGIIGLGAMSDSYNPCEKDLELTRGALKLINRYGYGVSLETKSDLVVRDKDILVSIASHSPVNIRMSVTTPYENIAKKVEPKSCSVKRRFDALKELSDAGIYTGVLMTPILPFIEDDSAAVIQIIDMAASAGCKFVCVGHEFGVTLRDSQRVHFLEKVEKAFPGMKDRYCAAFGDDYMCVSPNSEQLMVTLKDKCKRLNLKFSMSEIVADCKRPYQTEQISLFDL